MLSFRSFFIAAAAFATLTSASPTAGSVSVPNTARGLGLGGLLGHSGGGVCSNVCGTYSGYGSGSFGLGLGDNLLAGVLQRDVLDDSPTKREDALYTGDIIKTLYDGIKLIIVKIGQFIHHS